MARNGENGRYYFAVIYYKRAEKFAERDHANQILCLFFLRRIPTLDIASGKYTFYLI